MKFQRKNKLFIIKVWYNDSVKSDRNLYFLFRRAAIRLLFFVYKERGGIVAVNQYKKDGNGPNAHKKGNRTKSKRNPSVMVESSRRISEDISRYKEIAEKVRKSRKWKQEDLAGVYDRLNTHISESNEDEPLTIAGMMLAAGMAKEDWYAAVNGEYDYRLYEYIELHNINTSDAQINDDGFPYIITENGEILLIPYSDVMQKAILLKEAADERRLLKKGRVADIFNMKALHNWQEETSPHTVNQTLVIASEEQARKAIEALK